MSPIANTPPPPPSLSLATVCAQVVDTPGLFDSRPEMTNEMVLKKVASTALMVAPGPHVLLMTLVCGQRFTHEEQAVVKHLKDFFGKGSLQHTVVVFTRRDELDRKNVKIGEACYEYICTHGSRT